MPGLKAASTSRSASPDPSAPFATMRRPRPSTRPPERAASSQHTGETLAVTKLDRLARSLPDARDIVEELTAADVKLNIGGSVHDPNGRLLFKRPGHDRRIRIRPHQDADEGGHEGRQGERPAASQATQAQPHPGNSPGRALPSRATHHRRASRTLFRRDDRRSIAPSNHRRTWHRPNTIVGLYGLGLVTAPLPAPRIPHAGISQVMQIRNRADTGRPEFTFTLAEPGRGGPGVTGRRAAAGSSWRPSQPAPGARRSGSGTAGPS